MAPHSIWRHLLIEMKYAGYLAQQTKRRTHEQLRADRTIPSGFDFNVVPGLRSESRQKLGSFAQLPRGRTTHSGNNRCRFIYPGYLAKW